MTARNKREIIQVIIDDVQEPWIIMKPSIHDPTDSDPLCVFENPAEYKQAKTEIPLAWFQSEELEKIKAAVLSSLRQAEVMYMTQGGKDEL